MRRIVHGLADCTVLCFFLFVGVAYQAFGRRSRVTCLLGFDFSMRHCRYTFDSRAMSPLRDTFFSGLLCRTYSGDGCPFP